jgi:hypothetical protein
MAPAENRRTFISVEEEDDRAMEKAASSAALDFQAADRGVRRHDEPGQRDQVSANRTR